MGGVRGWRFEGSGKDVVFGVEIWGLGPSWRCRCIRVYNLGLERGRTKLRKVRKDVNIGVAFVFLSFFQISFIH